MGVRKDDIKAKLDYIASVISTDVPADSAPLLMGKLNELISMIGNIAETAHDAELQYKSAVLDAYKRLEADKPTSTVYNKVLDAEVADELALHSYAERLNSSLKTAIDGLRTMISYIKN